MAHGEPGWCPKCNGLMNNHAIGCEWAPNPPATEDQMKCYAACAAINPDNPAGVAEALPELVEVMEHCYGAMGCTMPGAAKAQALLAKLKARP